MGYILNVRDENGNFIPISALKGEKGEKGDSYVLTDADKKEIANIVLANLSTASIAEQDYVTEEQVQRMIDDAVADIGKEAVIISFSIEDFQFQAEEGMTWREWVNSEYNSEGACVYNEGDDTICYVEYSLNVLSPNNKGSDTIISGYFYYLS